MFTASTNRQPAGNLGLLLAGLAALPVTGQAANADIQASYLAAEYATAAAPAGGEFNSAAISLYIDPARTSWIAWNDRPDLEWDANGEGFLTGGGYGVDDSIFLTIVSPSGASLQYEIDQNDSLGIAQGNQQVLFGHPDYAPDVLRIDGSGVTAGTMRRFNEGGVFNGLFREAGNYHFSFSLRNRSCSTASHPELWLLVDAYAPAATCVIPASQPQAPVCKPPVYVNPAPRTPAPCVDDVIRTICDVTEIITRPDCEVTVINPPCAPVYYPQPEPVYYPQPRTVCVPTWNPRPVYTPSCDREPVYVSPCGTRTWQAPRHGDVSIDRSHNENHVTNVKNVTRVKQTTVNKTNTNVRTGRNSNVNVGNGNRIKSRNTNIRNTSIRNTSIRNTSIRKSASKSRTNVNSNNRRQGRPAKAAGHGQQRQSKPGAPRKSGGRQHGGSKRAPIKVAQGGGKRAGKRTARRQGGGGKNGRGRKSK